MHGTDAIVQSQDLLPQILVTDLFSPVHNLAEIQSAILSQPANCKYVYIPARDRKNLHELRHIEFLALRLSIFQLIFDLFEGGSIIFR